MRAFDRCRTISRARTIFRLDRLRSTIVNCVTQFDAADDGDDTRPFFMIFTYDGEPLRTVPNKYPATVVAFCVCRETSVVLALFRNDDEFWGLPKQKFRSRKRWPRHRDAFYLHPRVATLAHCRYELAHCSAALSDTVTPDSDVK